MKEISYWLQNVILPFIRFWLSIINEITVFEYYSKTEYVNNNNWKLIM